MLIALLLAALANDPSAASERDRVVYVKHSALDFTDVKVEAERVVPTYSLVKGRPKAHRRNLIELRESFRPELNKSRDQL